jgi:hypothetical protein
MVFSIWSASAESTATALSRYDHPSAAAALGTPVLATALHKKTAPPKNQKGWNGQRLAVSPFDGVSRIRFKGSLAFLISDCGLSIGLIPTRPAPNQKSQIKNLKFFRLSAASAAPPKRI